MKLIVEHHEHLFYFLARLFFIVLLASVCAFPECTFLQFNPEAPMISNRPFLTLIEYLGVQTFAEFHPSTIHLAKLYCLKSQIVSRSLRSA